MLIAIAWIPIYHFPVWWVAHLWLMSSFVALLRHRIPLLNIPGFNYSLLLCAMEYMY